MLRKLYDWTMNLAGRRHALSALGAVSFAESSVFPIPPDVLLIPMVIARPARAWLIAGVCTAASVLGGLAGYAIGFFLYETLGQRIIEIYGLEEQAAQFRAFYDQWGVWVVAVGGLTPVPYKVVTIVSGAATFDLVVFTLASIASRGARFFIVAGLLKFYGPPIRAFIEKRLTLLFWLFLVLLIGGFVAVSYL